MGPYPNWNHGVTPHTHDMARVRRTRQVNETRVIRVKNASYRSAMFDGTFELEDQTSEDPIQVTPKGKPYVKVICAWHGVTPDTEYPGLDLTYAKYDLMSGYSGDVADNIC